MLGTEQCNGTESKNGRLSKGKNWKCLDWFKVREEKKSNVSRLDNKKNHVTTNWIQLYKEETV